MFEDGVFGSLSGATVLLVSRGMRESCRPLYSFGEKHHRSTVSDNLCLQYVQCSGAAKLETHAACFLGVL